VGTVLKRRPVRVRRVAGAAARFGEARPTRARQWRLAGTTDRLCRLDKRDDHSAQSEWDVVRLRARLWLPMVAGSVVDRSPPEHRLGWQPRLGGQRLYAVPEFSLVVAVTAGAYGSSQGGAPSALENVAGDTALSAFVLPAAIGH